MGDEIITEKAGMWGNLAGGGTLFFYVLLIDNFPVLRQLVQGKPIELMHQGILDRATLKRVKLGEEDLNRLARDYGFENYDVFKAIILERDGRLSGVIKPELQPCLQGQSSTVKRKQM